MDRPPDAARINAADPARLLALLWGTAPGNRRGPERRGDLEEVVRDGIGLADAEGLDQVSMRRLAARLGISTMSLYTYVPGKAELLDLMVDRAYAGMDRPPLEPLTWRQRVTAVAGANWALAGAHPWLAEVATTRPGLGPGATAKYEWELGAFEGLGLDDVERDSWLTLLLTVVRGAALLAVEAARAREASGMDDAAWWRQAGPVLAAHLTPEAYPLAARVGTAVGMRFDAAVRPEHVFRFGLARILDALSTRDVGTDS